jgi:hypothetical protein
LIARVPGVPRLSPEAKDHGGGCPASTAQLLCRAMCRSLSKLIVARIMGPAA